MLPPVKPEALVRKLVAVLGLALLAAAAPAQQPAAERLLREAARLAESGSGEAALQELTLLVQQFPDDAVAPAAWLRIAELRRARGERDAAASALARLLGDHGRSAQAAEGLLLQGRMAVDDAQGLAALAAARNAFRRVPLLFGRELYPGLEARRAARVESGEVALLLDDPAAAAAEFLAALEDEPEAARDPAQGEALTGRARLGLARAWLAAGQWTAAAAVLEEAAARQGAADEAGRARARRLASLLERRVLRPMSGQRAWLTTGRFPPAGLELREPAGVAAASDGRLLVVDEKLPLVALLDARGRGTARQALGGVARPGWLASGHPFAVGAGGVVLPFDAASYAFVEPQRSAPLKNLLAAQPGIFGDWFVVAKGWRGVIHSPAAGASRELLAEARPDVVDLARGELGRVYALAARAGQVVRLGREGVGHAVVLTGDWRRPVALDVDELGYVYVLDRGERAVDLFAPGGRRLARVGPDLGAGIELRQPVDVAVDGAGRLFIADAKLPYVLVLE